MVTALGRLEPVPLRQVWPLEARDFTPWLADAENLALLADTLELGELELQGTELKVGNFNLDILARDVEGHVVVIENQFGPTDHTHLGQILTYLAGQEGQATIVWIAEKFREEHRAAIDWLNASTIDGFAFFAVEVEALRIGDSQPAPWFNIVAKPNIFTRGVERATRTASAGQLDDRAKAYVAYWSGFSAFLLDRPGAYKLRTAPRDYWASFGIGRSGFILVLTATFRDRKMGVEIYITHRAAKRAFDLLNIERTSIEAEFGEPLDWQRMNDKKTCRIALYRTDLDPRQENQRPTQYEWFFDRMQRFTQVFADRIRALPLDDVIETEMLSPTAEAADG